LWVGMFTRVLGQVLGRVISRLIGRQIVLISGALCCGEAHEESGQDKGSLELHFGNNDLWNERDGQFPREMVGVRGMGREEERRRKGDLRVISRTTQTHLSSGGSEGRTRRQDDMQDRDTAVHGARTCCSRRRKCSAGSRTESRNRLGTRGIRDARGRSKRLSGANGGGRERNHWMAGGNWRLQGVTGTERSRWLAGRGPGPFGSLLPSPGLVLPDRRWDSEDSQSPR
jgi:hypothetical protein